MIGWSFCACEASNEPSDSNKPAEPDKEETQPPTQIPSGNLIKINSNGSYTFLATSTNQPGGESVEIPTEYYIGKYAVTNQEWKAFIDETANPAPKYWTENSYPEGRAKHPVLWISYDDALAYCAWLNDQQSDWSFRIPTSAEWEYAAAGTQATGFPWGDSAAVTYTGSALHTNFNYNAVIATELLKTPNRIATYNHSKSTRRGEQEKIGDILSISATGGVKGWVNHTDYTGFIYTDIFTEINTAGGYTCPTDAYPEGISWCGCYNMCGNCWEWTSSIEIAQNGAEKGQSVNTIRGGSWYANASSCKASFRGEGRKASSAYNTVGLRLVAIKRP